MCSLLPSCRSHCFLRGSRSIDRNRRNFRWGRRADLQFLANFGVDFLEGLTVVLEVLADVFAALADALTRVAVPGAGFLDDVVVHGKIQHIAFTRDAFSVQNVELSLAERGGNLILYDLDLRPRANNGIAFLYGRNAANIDADRGVKLQCAASGCCLRIAEHDTDFFADLVDKDKTCARL